LTYDLGGNSRNWSNHRKSFQLPGCLKLALLAWCLAPGFLPALQAQSAELTGRRIIHAQQPDYPAVLKSKGIGGTVHLVAKVLASGNVASVLIRGGNPILAASAVNAVMKWKYSPAPLPSDEIVNFDFNPH